MKNLDLGPIGENQFRHWCLQNGAIPTKPENDQFGWDFFVELRATENPLLPLDSQAQLDKALVQVKASAQTNRRNVKAKLSALKFLVDTPLPAFILFLEYTDQSTLRGARLLHIGQEQIFAILKKVRVAERDGKSLNKVTMALSLLEAEKIDLSGQNLLPILKSNFVGGFANYISWKTSVCKNSGYDESSLKATFRLSGHVEDLVKFNLGIVPDMPIEFFSIQNSRFNIHLPKYDVVFESGTLSFTPTPCARVRLLARNSSHSRSAEMYADMFAPGLPGLPQGLQRYRIKNQYVDFTFGLDESRTDFAFNFDVKDVTRITDIANVLKFRMLLSMGGETRIDLILGSKIFGNLHAVNADASDDIVLVAEYSRILADAAIREQATQLPSYAFIDVLDSLRKNFDIFAMLTKPGLTFSAAPDGSVDHFTGGLAVVYLPITWELCSHTYFVVLRLDATVSKDDAGAYCFTCGQPSIRESGFENTSDFDPARVERLTDELQATEQEPVNLVRFLSANTKEQLTQTG